MSNRSRKTRSLDETTALIMEEMNGYPDEYRAYFAHLSKGEYYACHEALERLWLKDKNRFYQSLIQLAVALYHLSRGNVEGGRKLLAAAEEKLREYPVGHRGVDTAGLADWCKAFRTSLPPDRRAGFAVPIPELPYSSIDPALFKRNGSLP